MFIYKQNEYTYSTYVLYISLYIMYTYKYIYISVHRFKYGYIYKQNQLE